MYSAGSGQMALDRLGDEEPNPNSVFTRVLVPALVKPGMDLTALAFDVREDVSRLAASVEHEQWPAYYDETIGGRVYLAGLPREDAKPAEPPKPQIATGTLLSEASGRPGKADSLCPQVATVAPPGTLTQIPEISPKPRRAPLCSRTGGAMRSWRSGNGFAYIAFGSAAIGSRRIRTQAEGCFQGM
jgi:hypothetical protein